MARKRNWDTKSARSSVFQIHSNRLQKILDLSWNCFLLALADCLLCGEFLASNFVLRLNINQFVFASIGLMTFALCTAVIVGIIAYQACSGKPGDSLKK